ncbi:choice-of-anchor D domain-containing protein [Nocardioides plantarum]|uniref:Choice-of-anchor D domain-containing protein n=2 Tax=Nocardioides plantarum TaxID=29299 RepID=A0ABV5K7Q4_9ACTN|nr:choice-of-anchor D domain-containing protein [Nocardioides plantarum]
MPADPQPTYQLRVTAAYATSTATTTGTTVKSSVTVKNVSGVRQPTRSVRLYLTDGTTTYGLATTSVGSLAPSKSATVRDTTTAPLRVPAGRYALRACLGPIGSQSCRDSSPSITIGAARLAASPSTLAFGQVPVGETSTKEVTITNRGHATSGTVTVSFNGDPAFTAQSSTCGSSLDPGDSCRVKVTYAPTTPGEAASNLIASSPRGGIASIGLTGTGLGAATLSISPDSALYDDTLLDATSEPVTFTVTNTGNLPSGVPVVSLGGSTEFNVTTTTCTAALAPGATCTVTATFTPTTRGAATTDLTVSATPGGTTTAELAGTGLAPAELSLDPATAALPATVIGQQSEARTFTLTNDGDVTTGTPTIALTGDDAAQFTIDDNACTAALPAGASCSIDVLFAPTAAGEATASLTASATPGATTTSDLTGLGQTEPALSIDDTAYDYGYTGAASQHTFTITNDGDTPTGVPTVDLTGDTAFTITTNTCTTALAGDATCTVEVTYTGTGTDQQTAQLSVTATPGGTVTADLTGSPLALTIAPTTYNFGGIPVGDTSDPQSFTLTNHRLTAVQVDGEGTTGPFTIDDSCFTVTIPAGDTCTFTARFAPSSSGPATGSIDYFAQGAQAQVELTGTGLTPATFSLSTSTVDFGAYTPGDTGTQQVTVTNTGTQDSSTVGLAITGPDAAVFAVDSTDCPTTLAGGASCTVTLEFAPVALGDRSATLTVNGAPGATASLVGLGAPAGVTLYPATYDYGAVPVGGAAYFTFRVVNTTDNGEDMNSASSGPPFPLELNQDFTCVLIISTIQPHRWCTMTLSFKPQSVGSFNTTLTAGGTNFNTSSLLLGTGVPARGTAPSVSSPSSMPTSVALRGGKVVVRRE